MSATEQNELLRGGQFLVKETACEDVFTLEDLSEEQKMMRDSTKEFVDKELWAHWERFEKKDYAFTEETMRKAGEMGLLGVAVPEQYGGLGMGFVSTMLVCDYISGATGSFSTAFGAHTGIGTMPITLYGTEAQKQKYVPRLATGEWFGAYCLTEPGAGSDANSGKTKAVLSEDGSHYLISGQKMWISNAGFCNMFIVFARIENDKNITGFIVENDPSNGITMGDEEKKLGIHSSSTRQVFFTDTKVPAENMLSERGNGFKIAMNALNVGRIKLGVACLDAQRRITSAAVQYANERIQFNTPIAQFGAIKEKLAHMATSCYAGESACYRAAYDVEKRIQSFVAEGLTHQEAELKGVEDFAIECSLLKVGASEDIQNAADHGIQIMGGMGFSADMPMESAWRDARIGRIYEGTNEINRMLTIDMLLKRAMKGHIDLMTPAMAVQKELMSIPDFGDTDDAAFAKEIKYIKNFKKAILMVAGAAVQKLMMQLEKEQEVLMNIADMAIEVFHTESALLRVMKLAQKNGEEATSIQTDIMRTYLYDAADRINKAGKDALNSFADGDELRMMHIGLKRFTKVDPYNTKESRRRIADKLIADDGYKF